MICEKIQIKKRGSENYAALYTYIQDYSEHIGIEKRPMVIICPGGGYDHTSDREAEPIAMKFCAMGCHAAVLRYSTGPSRFPTALSELAYAVSYVRSHSKELHVDEDKIIVQGSSAGGHLAASLGCFWNRGFLEEVKNSIRPNGLILSYPVITTGEFAHKGSVKNLCLELKNADDFSDKKGTPIEEFLSLEKQVSPDVPPCFVWHTFEDESVPVENSLMFVSALRREGVSAEYHVFPHGCHGISLATEQTCGGDKNKIVPEAAAWIDLAEKWIRNL